jgi:RNA polymerase sigma-70 factor, ECF subfamily
LDTEAKAQRRTLSDVLYSDDTVAPVREAQWIALLRAIGAGDLRALRDLFEGAHAIVLTFISRVVDRPEIAERLTVEVFHDVWRHAAAFDPEQGTVLGWIMSQARSKAIDHRQRSDSRRRQLRLKQGAQ